MSLLKNPLKSKPNRRLRNASQFRDEIDAEIDRRAELKSSNDGRRARDCYPEHFNQRH